MTLQNWFRSLITRRPAARPFCRTRTPLLVERLEDRTVPTGVLDPAFDMGNAATRV